MDVSRFKIPKQPTKPARGRGPIDSFKRSPNPLAGLHPAGNRKPLVSSSAYNLVAPLRLVQPATRTLKTPKRSPVVRPRPSIQPMTQPAQIAVPTNINSKNHKTLKKVMLAILIVLILLATSACGGYFYYKSFSNSPNASAQPGNMPNNANQAHFAVYVPKNNQFVVATNFKDGPQSSMVIVANSNSDDRQITISQRQVDRYFSTDPSGLQSLLKSLNLDIGDYTKINNGTSYIVSDFKTALTIKEDILIIIKSTASLDTQEWVDLFNSLNRAN